MAINPNIALGLQPIQQPNILGQMGQMMALKAAQQDIEGSEGVRNALRGGAPEDPSSLLQYGKQGRATYESLLKGRKEQIESSGKRIGIIGQIAGYVRDNPTPENFSSALTNMVQSGVLTPAQAERVLADAGNDPSKIKSYAERAYSDAITAEARMKDATSRRNTDVSSGPGYMNAQLARERFNMEQQQQAALQRILNPSAAGPTAGPTAGPAAGPAPVNAFAPPSVNALSPQADVASIDSRIDQLIRVGSPQALQAVDALIKQRNILNPTQQIVQDARGAYVTIDQRTGVPTPVIGSDGQPLVGKMPPAPFESQYSQVVGKTTAERDTALRSSAEAAQDNLVKINETLSQIRNSDAITGFGAETLKNIERVRAQFLSDKKAGKRVADTEILDAMLGSDVFPFIQSLGIGARGLDTPAEREYLRSVMTGTVSMDKAALIKLTEIRRNIAERAIDKYNKKVESGELDRFFKTQGIQPQKIEKPSAASTGDISVDPSIQSLLNKYK